MFGKFKKKQEKRGPCLRIILLENRVDGLLKRIDALEREKRSISERTTQDEVITTRQIINEWLNGKEEADGS